MKHTKEEILKQLVFAEDTDQFYFFETADTKEKRNLVQNATFYRCLDIISKHTWDELEELKLKTLVKLFWFKQMKWGWETIPVPNVAKTSSLTKEQASQFIDALIKIAKFLWLGEIITPRQVQSLYDSYN